MHDATIDLMRYIALQVSSTCPDCKTSLVLLSPREAEDGGPAYYICSCGYLGRVGDKRLRRGTEEEQ